MTRVKVGNMIGFNGAAVKAPRKPEDYSLPADFYKLLQWSRGEGTAETGQGRMECL